jgi:cytochrome c oxidase cbb3-type subunit 3
MTQLTILLILLALVGQPAWAAPDGARLFSQNCAACHGDKGTGGVGVPLSLPSFLNSVPDSYLKKTIRHGRPGRVMPAFNKLSDAEVDAIVKYVRSWSDKPAPKYSDKPVVGNTAHGAEIFKARCAACHGANGGGGHGTGVTMSRPRNLPILAPALNNAGFLAAAPDQMIKATLMKGRKGTPMVSFLKHGLKEKDIDDVVAYVRSFQKNAPAHPSEALEKEPPVIVRESPYSVQETVQNLKNAIIGQNFRLIRIQYLDQGFVDAGKENKDQVMVYSCNFYFLDDALKVDPRVGLFLPCRVTVMKHNGKVLVMAINPKRLSAVFNNSELNELCKKMYETYVNMIEEATL